MAPSDIIHFSSFVMRLVHASHESVALFTFSVSSSCLLLVDYHIILWTRNIFTGRQSKENIVTHVKYIGQIIFMQSKHSLKVLSLHLRLLHSFKLRLTFLLKFGLLSKSLISLSWTMK